MGLAAAVIGFIAPGIGQFANREYFKGLIVLFLWVGLIGTGHLLFSFPLLLLGIIYFIFSMYSALDAYIYNPLPRERTEKQIDEFTVMQEETLKKKEEQKEKIKSKIIEQMMQKYGERPEIVELERISGTMNWKCVAKIGKNYYQLSVNAEGKIIQ